MDELERALRGVLTDERLQVPLVPDALHAIQQGVRRRRRRRTVGAVVAAVAVISAGGTAAVVSRLTDNATGTAGPSHATTTAPVPSPTGKPLLPPARTTVVPWSGIVYDPAKPPAFPGAAADPSVPWCTTRQLRLLPAAFQGATGSVAGSAVVENTSMTTCALQGQPVVSMIAVDGRRLAQSRPDTFYVDPWLKLAPHARAAAFVDWSPQLCRQPAPARMVVTLPHRGGSLQTAQSFGPRCDGSRLPRSGGRLSVDGFGAVAAAPARSLPAFTPEAGLVASISQWSQSTVAGGVLDYRVELMSAGGAVTLDPCLPYRERLVDPRTGDVVAEERYTLDCVASPPIEAAASMHRVVFDMRLHVPTTLAPGDYALDWQSVLQPVSATAGDVVHVIAGPAQCSENQLTLSKGRSGAAAGSYVDVVVLTNHTGAACALRGYPGVQFVDPSGNPLPTTPHHGTAGAVFDVPMTTVVLAADGGTASFALGGADFVPPAGATPCTPTRGVLVIPPGLRHQVPVTGVGQDCQNGRVDVSVVVSGRDGPQPG